MSIVRYDPFKTLEDINQILNGAFDVSKVDTGSWVPAMDLAESANEYIVYSDLPGVRKEDIEISMENHTLSIKGSRTFDFTERRDIDYRSERVQGVFYRKFHLPEASDAEGIEAKLENGVLRITVPKCAPEQATLVEIH